MNGSEWCKYTLFTLGMNADQCIGFGRHFPYQHLDLNDGIKYLGFTLKTNCYGKENWWWLFSKIENITYLWCNRWLSRGGRLVLFKTVLKSIPFYWNTIAHIPKGTLEKNLKFCYNFFY
jgi:hypothetical protein